MLWGYLQQLIETCKRIRTQSKLLTDNSQGDVGCNQSSYQQYQHLDNIRIPDHLHPTEGDDERKDRKADHDQVKAFTPGQVVDRQRTEVQNGGKVDKDVQEQPEDCHDHGHGFIVACL